MLRPGLCCLFLLAPIRFRTTTARVMKTQERSEQSSLLNQLCLANTDPTDFPAEWLDLDAAIDIEAKAKDLAVVKLKQDLTLPPWRSAET